ncbi:hypothetical protein TWF225_007469 [Orbilia oligospora]|uniref:T6SS Phospholipase effector Tle1-like catalytic domain-containing protein n=1 Tax=Orbilia oligospora TaxID=2813651 RepID=A0A7C8NYG3_ORBOL|nr:hypothetical protein TWF751_011525 [Orbilia oligospora]KAF3179795.1 hypothetical protein TWF225_007469 [Orbilia oligospora]KAF3241964.1 hypothetical protein TWF128_010681 [Orbilia oligospora]KAF3241965.1 hypothetical protein TWF128_010681 [Orbilia oligospora]KAF3252271.1 hypothetical protein TWF217_007807 [Orbilia oligospora]
MATESKPGLWSNDPDAYPTASRDPSVGKDSPPMSPGNGTALPPIPEARQAPPRPHVDTNISNGTEWNEKNGDIETPPGPGRMRKSSTIMSAMTKDSFDLELDPLPYKDAGITEIQVRPKKLVLFFDGTGNKFQGNMSDTNIIKMYQMLDKHDPQVYLYYQPGIGTYVAGEHDFAPGPFSKMKRFIDQSIDQAVGTSFDHHVIQGYQFIMRYYSPGDKIYIFGFSRGAYTARFLTQMVMYVGLLSRGNEEMVPFAYKSFAKFERLRRLKTKRANVIRKHMTHFKETFCRTGVKVHILGLYDTVNSVGRFELPLLRKSFPESQQPAADHVRHAVAIDERRLKFKPSLFAQMQGWRREDHDVKEVWFPGNHADIGGGWTPEEGVPMISDIALAWMLEEVLAIEDKCVGRTSPDRLPWKMDEVEKVFHAAQNQVGVATIHDALKFNGGWSHVGVLSWWVLEVLPLFTRLELEFGRWVPRHWPPNLGFTRDIPDDAVFHESVHRRERAGCGYLPINDGYMPCKKSTPETEHEHCKHCDHRRRSIELGHKGHHHGHFHMHM